MATPNVRPLHDRILVLPKEMETTTAGGIVLPDTGNKEKPVEGTIIAVGTGKVVDGKTHALGVKVGDKILYGKYAGTSVKFGDKEYLFMREEDVMGVLE
jgi:chaperonin GroES